MYPYHAPQYTFKKLHNKERVATTFVLVQYRSQSLIRYIEQVWTDPSCPHPQRVQVIPPPSGKAGEYYLGTADAVRQNAKLISEHRPALAAAFSSDHIYRINVDAMARFHRESGADISISAVPVAIEEGGHLAFWPPVRMGAFINFRRSRRALRRLRQIPCVNTHQWEIIYLMLTLCWRFCSD